MIKKSIFLLLSFLLLFGLAGCTKQSNLTKKWQETAEEKGILLTSNDGVLLMFSPEGFKGISYDSDTKSLEKPFPFENEKLYSDYQVIQKKDRLLINTEDDLSYELVIKGDRLFYDEENKVEYRTDSYLIEKEESKE